MFSRRLLNLTTASQRRSVAVRSYAGTSPANATAADRTRQAANPADNFLTAGADTAYFDEMLSAYRQDPESVHVSWRAYFRGLDKGIAPEKAFMSPPGLTSSSSSSSTSSIPMTFAAASGSSDLSNHLKVQLLVRAYQVRGHHIAQLDPLGISQVGFDRKVPDELKLEHYGWSEKDLDTEYSLGPGILPRFAIEGVSKMTLRDIIGTCERLYSNNIGFQFVHIPSKEECDWIRARCEIPKQWSYSLDKKRQILDRLIWSDSFERFVATKFPTEKRFGLEGCESLIPGMKALIDQSVEHNVKHVIIGMPHRGRLNVLANVVRKPGQAIFNEFIGTPNNSTAGGGDVKYHLGANYERPVPNGKRVSLSLVANPSHLEAANGPVLGKTRGLQVFEKDPTSAMAVLLHGDAAFAGQGVVYETMGMVNLPEYKVNGTVHVVVNNQIGFTTDPRFSRSTPYPSDIAQAFDAPIFHCNGDNPEAVTYCCELAADYRAKFKKDVVVDIVCYRRHGHNEIDQPQFTQPKQYEAIAKQPTTVNKYIEQLVNDGVFTREDIEQHQQQIWDQLEKQFAEAKDYKPSDREWLSSSWYDFPTPDELAKNILPHPDTGVKEETLKSIGQTISTVPDGFTPHKNVARILAARGKSISDGNGIDWATAEALAFGSLLAERTHVRISGQDVERGTYSQRHAKIVDQKNQQVHTALEHVSPSQAPFTASNSHLSEFGVLGFELGYSLVSPDLLTIWEAQFGDFANGAQVIIDQFIASGERKWLQRTGLVMSMPHGFDGQGPEHSSGRIERFLQLCDDSPFKYPTEAQLSRQHQDCNMQIVYPTTPANLFHVLRRQVRRQFRKPLILFFSKALLRHPMARSNISEMVGNTCFQRYIPESNEGLQSPEQIRRHILCSGQVYVELMREREARGIKDVAISRVEQISPFPYELITPHIDSYPNAETVWCQEEPANNGSWSYVEPRLNLVMGQTQNHLNKKVHYVGRSTSASVATGLKASHKAEVKEFLEEAFSTEAKE